MQECPENRARRGHAVAVIRARVQPIPAPADGLLTGFEPVHYADAFAVPVSGRVDPQALASAVFAAAPAWVAALMAVRHAAMAPFGVVASSRALARAARAANGSGERVGIFPVLSRAASELLLGLDDRHLDFRVSVRVTADGGQRLGVLTTLVRFHGRLGRAYFAVVKPFHRVIVPAMLRRAARRLEATAEAQAERYRSE